MLDLRTVGMEADLTRSMPPDVQYGGPWQEAALRHAETIDRLLVHVRALRAALQEVLGGSHYGEFAVAEVEKLSAVLAAARDGEAP